MPHTKVGVLLVRKEMPLFSEILAEALKVDPVVTLLEKPMVAAAAQDFCTQRKPDVVLIEVTELSAESLRSTVQPIKVLCEDAPVVLVADAVLDDTIFVAALEAGAAGIVDASGGMGEVVSAVRAAADGQRLIDTARLSIAVETAARSREWERKRLNLLGHLSEREREVLACLTRGLRNSEIALELSISPRTVEKHVHHILSKLEVGSRLAAVALAMEAEGYAHQSIRETV